MSIARNNALKPRKIARRSAKKTNRTRKGAPPSISKLIKEADRLFSIRVRKDYRCTVGGAWLYPIDETTGDIISSYCYTCGRVYPIKKLHCGHYLSRFYKAARWNYDNARPQCMMCNLWKRGDPIVFRQNLIKEIGEARVLAVEALRDAPLKLSREYLTNLIQQLSQNI